MAQQDILDYIRKTPHNSNVNVVKGMLDAEGSGGGSWTVLTEESVTTSSTGQVIGAPLAYSQLIDAETIRVIFDGIEYECFRIVSGSSNIYGGFGEQGPDFSQYPFMIESTNSGNAILTETAGTYTIKIEAPQSGGGSSDFSTAEVTVVNSGTLVDVLGSMPICHEAGEFVPEAPAFIESTFSVEPETTSVFTVPIYKNGVLDVAINDGMQITSVTGDAEWESPDLDVYITGNCTITAHWAAG